MSWTDYAGLSGFDPPFAPFPLLDFDGLCRVVRFIEHMRQEGRHPRVGGGDGACAPGHAIYD
jgi:hypothetical protein